MRFQGRQGLATVEEARCRLLVALAAADRVEIDLTGVDEADLAFLQLLVAAGKSARAGGKRLSWQAGENSPVAVAMRRAGLTFDADGAVGAGP